MALLATSFIWVAAVAVVALLVFFSGVFVTIYNHPREKSHFVNFTVVLSLTALLSTVLLLPVDIALIASTTDNKTGLKKDWADPAAVNNIVLSLKIVYYMLYSLDALCCIVFIPFAYFWYEEWDIESTAGSRIRGALKYTAAFIALIVILFIVGLFIPAGKSSREKHLDLDYFRRLLVENSGEQALSFIIGILLVLGTVLYILYTGAGFALFPISLIKSIPSVSVTSSQEARDALAINKERQRMIEARNAGGSLNAKDKKELEDLQREERTLTRRQRLADEGHNKWLLKLEAIGRPFKIAFGMVLLGIALFTVISMLLTCIDKAINSYCGHRCGYILATVHLFNPMNWIFTRSARVFPIDYIIAILLVLFLFISSVYGLAFIGIRFLWLVIFKIRNAHTKPQALLMGTVMLTLISLALNYALTMIIAPQYSHFGGQKYCSRTVGGPGTKRDCTYHDELIFDCTADATGDAADICTPTVVTTFINRITINFPALGAIIFWGQFVFIGVFIITTITGIIKSPKMDQTTEEEIAEEEEEESLLGATRNRMRGAWDDVRGSAS